MSDQEVADLYAALEATPAVDTPSHPHDVGFPFNQRFLMAGWKHLFFHPQRFVADTTQSDAWNRGKYIVFGPGHCVTCHSPRNPIGGIDPGKELSGNPDKSGPGGKTPSLLTADLVKGQYDQTSLAQVTGRRLHPGDGQPRRRDGRGHQRRNLAMDRRGPAAPWRPICWTASKALTRPHGDEAP